MLTLFDYHTYSEKALAPNAHHYYSSGSNAEITLNDNIAAYNRIKLTPRVLKSVANRSTTTTLGDHKISMPAIVAPTAFLGMAHTDGELAVARAASASNTIMICSTLSNNPIEAIVAATSAPVWFQLYVYRNKTETTNLIARAKSAGCQALVITVDAPLLGQRDNDVRNQFKLPSHLSLSNLHALGHDALPEKKGHSSLAHYFENLIDQNLSWRDIDWLRREAGLPIYLKGILHPEDARLAIEHGVDGIIVSNHGGRQLDGSIASIDALPAICEQARGQLNVIVDGGIRRGTDILKACALGADCVAVGRPVIWGLNHSGEEGVSDIFNILKRELDLAMALSGCSQIKDITTDIIA